MGPLLPLFGDKETATRRIKSSSLSITEQFNSASSSSNF